MDEQIIVTLTTWKPRMKNIPAVLDSIFSQTLPPDLVVLNLADDEIVPQDVQSYLSGHGVEINRMADTKVYKKLIPTLKKYPEACVISIDDDWIYPAGMIADFMNVHSRFPDNPISGNNVNMYSVACHCGCASLTKAEYFGGWLGRIDERVIRCCASDDLVYTYMAERNGRSYVHTEGTYYENMESLSDEKSYSRAMVTDLDDSWNYLESRFGPVFPHKLLVHLHVNQPYCLPLFIKRLENIRGCIADLFITYSQDDSEIQAVKDTWPEIHLQEVSASEDGVEPFLRILNENRGYDFALKLTTWDSHRMPFRNSLNLAGHTLIKAMSSPFLNSKEALESAVTYLCGHPGKTVICSREGFSTIAALRGKSFRECCPASIFLCRAEAGKPDINSGCRRSAVKLVTGLSGHTSKKIFHYLFSIERNQNGNGKILTIFGIPFRYGKR